MNYTRTFQRWNEIVHEQPGCDESDPYTVMGYLPSLDMLITTV